MPLPMHIDLEPDEKYNASLKGSDYGDSLAKSYGGAKISYQVTDSISVHGHAELNGKKALASLVTFKIEASGPRERPVKKLELDLVFEDGDGTAKTDARIAGKTAPRIIKLLPGRAGYKVECTEGTQTTKTANEIVGRLETGADFAKAGAEAKHGKEKEVERKVEFYSFVRGSDVPSDDYHLENNTVHLEFTGDLDKDSKVNSGVPPVVEVVILLMRVKDGPFRCECANFDVKVDVKESISKFFGWKRVRSNPKVFDVTQNEQPKKPIDPKTLEIFNDPEDKNMKELVKIGMSVYYEKWKFEKAADK